MPNPSKSGLPTDKRSGDFRSMKTFSPASDIRWMKKKQALQAARAFAGKGAVLIARATSESSTMPQ